MDSRYAGRMASSDVPEMRGGDPDLDDAQSFADLVPDDRIESLDDLGRALITGLSAMMEPIASAMATLVEREAARVDLLSRIGPDPTPTPAQREQQLRWHRMAEGDGRVVAARAHLPNGDGQLVYRYADGRVPLIAIERPDGKRIDLYPDPEAHG